MYDTYIIKVIAIIFATTFITRCLIILLPSRYAKAPFVKEFNSFFPILILTLLIIYSVKDAQWNIQALIHSTFAYPEILGIATTALVHILAKRKIFLSIVAGTITYIFVQMLQQNLLQ